MVMPDLGYCLHQSNSVFFPSSIPVHYVVPKTFNSLHVESISRFRKNEFMGRGLINKYQEDLVGRYLLYT